MILCVGWAHLGGFVASHTVGWGHSSHITPLRDGLRLELLRWSHSYVCSWQLPEKSLAFDPPGPHCFFMWPFQISSHCNWLPRGHKKDLQVLLKLKLGNRTSLPQHSISQSKTLGRSSATSGREECSSHTAKGQAGWERVWGHLWKQSTMSGERQL